MAFTFFFRDLHTLEMLREHVIPPLRTRRHIHIWDAGCASGQEPYTLAMLIRENMGEMIFRNMKIHATDLDGSDLFGKIIEEGEYPGEQVKRIPEPYLERYFLQRTEGDSYQVIDEIRKRVEFSKHDLLSLRPVRTDFSLVMCKNVLLHFTEAERIAVLRMFHGALEEGGYLVVEQTQKLPDCLEHMFTPVVPSAQIFRKVASGG